MMTTNISVSSSASIRLGTRTSKMALKQADILRGVLASAAPELAIDIIPMKSSGDWRPEQGERNFAAMGATKGLFAKELEEALLSGEIDLAVHSAKDLETSIPDALCLAAFLPRDDSRDAFISFQAAHPRDLPGGARVGTSSLRRAAQILHMRPDLVVVPLRGNADTRLRKLADGQADALLLAYAGLQRIDAVDEYVHILPLDDMLPAAAQGALVVEMRRDHTALYDLVRRINCARTETCVTIEREFLRRLDGSCHTPVAALATLRADGRIDFSALVATPDGRKLERRHEVFAREAALRLAGELGGELRGYLPPDLLTASQAE